MEIPLNEYPADNDAFIKIAHINDSVWIVKLDLLKF